MDTPSSTATEVAALIALGGVLISASVAYVTASRSVYVNAITAARIEWLENIRELIVQFRELHLKMSIEFAQGKPDNERDHYKINRTYETLRLSLGRGSIEHNVMKLARCCLITMSKFQGFQLTSDYSGILAAHTRWLLEWEWLRAKSEAGNLLLQPYYRAKLFQKETDYLYFCQREGAFLDIHIARTLPSTDDAKPSASPASSAPP